MNQLSQLLYFADVFGTLKAVLGVFGALGALVGTVIMCCALDAKYYMARRLGTNLILAAIVCILLGVFVPTKNTMYAIAASEMGESVLQSETGSLATQALNVWLKKQIAPTPATTPPE